MDLDHHPDESTLDAHHRHALNDTQLPPGRGKARQRPLDSCVICLEAISERAVAIPCDHCAFDFLCLVSWTQAHPTCPLCQSLGGFEARSALTDASTGKNTLTAVQYDFRAPDDYKTYTIPKPPEASSQPSRASHNPINAPRRQLPPRRRRRRRPPPPPRPLLDPSEAAALRRRKYVYAHSLFSQHVGANRVSQHRDFTPAVFAKSALLQSRARHWLRRELRVFAFLSPDCDSDSAAPSTASAPERGTPAARTLRRQQNAEFVLEYLVSLLKTVDIRGAGGHAQTLTAELLGTEHAALFLHELNAWLRSPYTQLEDWDRHVQYERAVPED